MSGHACIHQYTYITNVYIEHIIIYIHCVSLCMTSSDNDTADLFLTEDILNGYHCY